MPSSHSPSAICPCTGLGIPECSCRRCLEEQMRSFSPLLRDASQAVGLGRVAPGKAAQPPEQDRRAA